MAINKTRKQQKELLRIILLILFKVIDDPSIDLTEDVIISYDVTSEFLLY